MSVAKMTTKVVTNDYFFYICCNIIYLTDGGKSMTDLEKNINHYMDIKGIKMYTHLLVAIAHELGIKGQKAYDFANQEKANFSKMLKGQRPLKYEFIIPLEKIFGVSLARMKDPDSYKLPLDKNNIPYSKGFRYYAYLDDPVLYKKELVTLLTKTGENTLTQTDEFGKTFLDYVVEYNSINGIRFLRDTYHLKLRFGDNQFDTEPKGMFWVNDKGIELARIVANSGDVKLFTDIYDPYYQFALGFYSPSSIYCQDDYFEILLDHEELYKTIFEIKKYEYELTRHQKKTLGKDTQSFSSINPVINGVLGFCLRNLSKYKKQAVEILKFGAIHNRSVMNGLEDSIDYYVTDEIGELRNWKRNNEIADVVIVADVKDIKDKEIIDLINELPKFKSMR